MRLARKRISKRQRQVIIGDGLNQYTPPPAIYSTRTMIDCVSLPLEAHDDTSAFLNHAWNIGRAYRNQALELISICQLLSRIAPPKFVHEDAKLRRYLDTSGFSRICLPSFDNSL